MISADDEGLHPVGRDSHWQESYYFNWFDPVSESFGLARVGYRPREQAIDGIVVVLRDGRPHYIYPGVDIALTTPWRELDPRRGLRAGRLCCELIEPLAEWRLRLDGGRHTMDLRWHATTPPFDYGAATDPMPDDPAPRHFEQSGRVTGWTRFKGQRVAVAGSGQRDKSWGTRDWARVAGWNWISAQFGDLLTFNAWETRVGGHRQVSGFVFHDGAAHAIVRLGIDFTWHRREVPATARLRITDSSETTLVVDARAIGQCPLVKRGHFIQESPARFATEWQGRPIDGVGVIEHTWPAGVLGLLQRTPELLWTAATAMEWRGGPRRWRQPRAGRAGRR